MASHDLHPPRPSPPVLASSTPSSSSSSPPPSPRFDLLDIDQWAEEMTKPPRPPSDHLPFPANTSFPSRLGSSFSALNSTSPSQPLPAIPIPPFPPLRISPSPSPLPGDRPAENASKPNRPPSPHIPFPSHSSFSRLSSSFSTLTSSAPLPPPLLTSSNLSSSPSHSPPPPALRHNPSYSSLTDSVPQLRHTNSYSSLTDYGLPHHAANQSSLAPSLSRAPASFLSIASSANSVTFAPNTLTVRPKIAVLGYGLYGRALAARLRATHAYKVSIGSRYPAGEKVSLTSAVSGATIVFIALPKSAYASCIAHVGTALAPGATLVDITNHALSERYSGATMSNAEELQRLVPDGVNVVKAFNNLSSYELSPGAGRGTSKRLPVIHMAGEEKAVQKVANVVESMRLLPVNFGGLEAARELEALPHRLFPTWRWPAIIGAVVCAWWILYSVLTAYVFHASDGRPSREWDDMALSTFSAASGETAMTLFALTFLAGPVALIVQVFRGSIAKPFGRAFGAWLSMRKELGMVAFSFAVTHVLAGSISSARDSFGWKGAAAPVTGIVSFMAFAVLASSSNASVSDAMSWAEFRAVFSYVGAFALAAGVLHQGLWGAIQRLQMPGPDFWVGGGKILPSYWLGIILPLLTLLLRAWSWSPVMTGPLKRMRGERKSSKCMSDEVSEDYMKPVEERQFRRTMTEEHMQPSI